MLRREDLETREDRWLNRWATRSTGSGGRRRAEAVDPLRTDFQRDRDRIIHSTAFRRLQHKTQVLAAFEGDHYRSRMTHSLEVSQMARSVATALALNADLAEAVALAHDLGHPPFGHAGEDGLNELMANHGGFRHNAQGARIVDYLEDRYGDGFGLNLTVAVRRSLLKGNIPPGYPLSSDLATRQPPPLEATVVDLCDRIAYLCHDLDDGLRVGAFTTADVGHLALWQQAQTLASTGRPGRVISRMVALLIQDLVTHGARTLANAETLPKLAPSDTVLVVNQELLGFLRERFYRADFVLAKMAEGKTKIREVFARLVHNPTALPPAVQARIEHDGLERTVCDYVAGMTDRYLLRQ